MEYRSAYFAAKKLKFLFILVLVLDPAEIEEEEPLPLECIALLETLITANKSYLTLRFLNVCEQTSSDSGILVIALAYDICFNPNNIFNKYNNVRGQLFACLQNDILNSFNSESRNISRKIKNVITFEPQ